MRIETEEQNAVEDKLERCCQHAEGKDNAMKIAQLISKETRERNFN